MRSATSVFVPTLMLAAVLMAACSDRGDTALTESDPSVRPVRIHGNVRLPDGRPAGGHGVVLRVGADASSMRELWRGTAGPVYGDFVLDAELRQGVRIEAVVGTERRTRVYDGGAYVYFGVTTSGSDEISSVAQGEARQR